MVDVRHEKRAVDGNKYERAIFHGASVTQLVRVQVSYCRMILKKGAILKPQVRILPGAAFRI